MTKSVNKYFASDQPLPHHFKLIPGAIQVLQLGLMAKSTLTWNIPIMSLLIPIEFPQEILINPRFTWYLPQYVEIIPEGYNPFYMLNIYIYYIYIYTYNII